MLSVVICLSIIREHKGMYKFKIYLCALTNVLQSTKFRTNDDRQTEYIFVLTLCVPCIILQCVNEQRDAQFLR